MHSIGASNKGWLYQSYPEGFSTTDKPIDTVFRSKPSRTCITARRSFNASVVIGESVNSFTVGTEL